MGELLTLAVIMNVSFMRVSDLLTTAGGKRGSRARRRFHKKNISRPSYAFKPSSLLPHGLKTILLPQYPNRQPGIDALGAAEHVKADGIFLRVVVVSKNHPDAHALVINVGGLVGSPGQFQGDHGQGEGVGMEGQVGRMTGHDGDHDRRQRIRRSGRRE